MNQQTVDHDTEASRTNRARGGRKPRWGAKRSVRTQVYVPAWLVERIEMEALARNVRAGDPNAWTYSSVAAETLLEVFGGYAVERGAPER